MSKTILVIPDPHAHPDHDNSRADLLANLIIDVRPDIVVNLGDAADMASLSSYDKGKRSFQGKSYRKDLDAHLEFQSRMWDPVRARKKKLPYSLVLEGNHEHRIEKALDLSPELEGTIGFSDLAFDEYYDQVVRYRGGSPGRVNIEGVTFAHYLPSGVMGRPIGGLHPASSLLSKQFKSCVVGHLHTADYSIATDGDGRKIHGLVAGVFTDYDFDWAGDVSHLYWRGVVILNNVADGNFDPEFVSIDRLKRIYNER